VEGRGQVVFKRNFKRLEFEGGGGTYSRVGKKRRNKKIDANPFYIKKGN